VLQRVYGFDHCPDHGEGELARWIDSGIFNVNLERIARSLAECIAIQPAAQAAKAA
jgi:hypothetical protein